MSALAILTKCPLANCPLVKIMSIGELSVGEMSVGEMSGYHALALKMASDADCA